MLNVWPNGETKAILGLTMSLENLYSIAVNQKPVPFQCLQGDPDSDRFYRSFVVFDCTFGFIWLIEYPALNEVQVVIDQKHDVNDAIHAIMDDLFGLSFKKDVKWLHTEWMGWKAPPPLPS